jgi:predicted  nucleic acid-binding Zn-ribbon protein
VEELAESFIKGWTPGGVGIWVIVIGGLVAWWKGLPAFLEALANRQSKMEERMASLLQATTDRFTRELEAADKRHEDCMKGQERLIERIGQLERRGAEDRECIEKQQETIAGLKRQIVQLQVSAVRTEGVGVSPVIQGVVARLDALPGVGE